MEVVTRGGRDGGVRVSLWEKRVRKIGWRSPFTRGLTVSEKRKEHREQPTRKAGNGIVKKGYTTGITSSEKNDSNK